MQAWYAGPANEPVVSHVEPTDDAVRQGPTWNWNCVVLGMGEADRYRTADFNLHHYDSLLDLVALQIRPSLCRSAMLANGRHISRIYESERRRSVGEPSRIRTKGAQNRLLTLQQRDTPIHSLAPRGSGY